jgi:hypothetical protein
MYRITQDAHCLIRWSHPTCIESHNMHSALLDGPSLIAYVKHVPLYDPNVTLQE